MVNTSAAGSHGGRDYIRDSGNSISLESHERLVTKMPSFDCSMPRLSLPRFLDRVSSANNFAFAERLDGLFQSLEDETKKLFTDDQPRFLAAIKRSRNKLAHITDGATGETFAGKEYAHVNLCLHAWLVILMLRLCGVPEELVRQRMVASQFLFWGPFTFAPRTA